MTRHTNVFRFFKRNGFDAFIPTALIKQRFPRVSVKKKTTNLNKNCSRRFHSFPLRVTAKIRKSLIRFYRAYENVIFRAVITSRCCRLSYTRRSGTNSRNFRFYRHYTKWLLVVLPRRWYLLKVIYIRTPDGPPNNNNV